ncbi:terminase large subunit [Caudoviricetes sp.]|nr:terminase large subunit [Caudoviricetes sp.]
MTELWDPALADDLERFVMFVFPWGKINTPLADFKGPRSWQRDELQAISAHIQDNRNRMAKQLNPIMYQSATASGRGGGKSSLTAWLNMWMMTTRLGSTTINTANTESQLKTRTWAELGKWHTLAINSHWFDRTALSLRPADWFEQALKTQLKVDTGYYYSQAQLWSEENPDAFAGVHNHNGVLLVFDEASGIPEGIWTVSEGFFTEPILDRYWFCFSNPRRNTGAFFECFHKHRNYWRRRNLDSRTVEGTDVTLLNQIIQKHGEDSDPARVEVKGEFPKQGDKQFISRELIDNALERELTPDQWAPLIMGVDPARYGDDKTVIRFRQGRNGRVVPPIKLKGKDNMEVANECAHLITKYNPDAVCIDAGNGTGIIDRLREMKYKVHEVWFGSKSPEPEWSNLRTYMWAQMRDWLGGACIDNDPDLIDDLAGPEYKFQGTSDKMMLESKEQLKSRGFASPDDADALACTFAIRVARKDQTAMRGPRRVMAKDIDYDVFG